MADWVEDGAGVDDVAEGGERGEDAEDQQQDGDGYGKKMEGQD